MKRSYMVYYEVENKEAIYSGNVAIRKNEDKHTTDIILDYVKSGKGFVDYGELKINIFYKI